jgi:glycogen debranching enzyme
VSFRIDVGPAQLALHQGHSALITERDGQIREPSAKGYYFRDTRLVSCWRIYANGEEWDYLNAAPVSHFAARSYLINRAIKTPSGVIPRRAIQLTISRWIDGGMHEDLVLENFGARPAHFFLEIETRGDFADIAEARAGEILRRGRIASEWSQEPFALKTRYCNQDFVRELVIRTPKDMPSAVCVSGRISFAVDLAPKAKWRGCLLYEPGDADKSFGAPLGRAEDSAQSDIGKRSAAWRENVLRIRASDDNFAKLFDQSIDDMAALRFPIGDEGGLLFAPAAGIPWYLALFGRDSLIASLQNAIIFPDFARAALKALGSFQAKERDDFRDAEPGKILHELRLGELVHLGIEPQSPYYGTADATILYLIALHTAWRCAGDAQILKDHLEIAEHCLEWIDRYGDRDGDGFQEYETRSPKGYENQSWKDSGTSVVYPDGSQVKGPKALCELQGYVYDAWRRMAQVYRFLGKEDRARVLLQKAEDLFERFNRAFWDEESDFYAFALDGDKRKVTSIASNPGHCLWSGIVPPERAGRVVKRLMQPDMWSGWGVRTLSSQNPAYNPHSYQRGSVWPHDNGIIAMGMRRYGYAEEAARIAHAVTGAGGFFSLHQMPELYSGVERGPMQFPVRYLGANVPQAWAAGSIFAFLQMLVGFQPDAPSGKLYIDPYLPEWLPHLELLGLSAGRQKFDLRLWRQDGQTCWETLSGDRSCIEQRRYGEGL